MNDTDDLTVEAPTDETGPGYTEAGPEASAPPVVPDQTQGYAGGKFSSVEELEAAYAELAGKQSDPAPAEQNGLDPAQVKDEDLNRERAAQELAKSSGGALDIADMEREFLDQGALSDATYAKLAGAGIGRELVDRYIDANVAQADQFAAEVKAIAGGEAEYTAMTDWARTNLAPEEIAGFDRMAGSGDTALIKLAVRGMTARWHDAVGQPPQLVSGSATASAPAPTGYRSAQEMVQAMRDPRYGRDPAYTHDVESRVGHSHFF